MLVLYCAAGYPGYCREVPGIGIVLRTETCEAEDIVYSRFLPPYQPVQREAIAACLSEEENKKVDRTPMIGQIGLGESGGVSRYSPD